MFETGEPYTGRALISAFTQLQAETTAYLETLSPSVVFASQGSAWAPAAHVRHLAAPVRLVGQVLRSPRMVLRLTFGQGDGRSRDFAAVRTAYLAALGRGAQAPYTPSAKPPSSDLAAGRAQLLASLEGAVGRLTTSIASWDEVELDRYRLPHPLLRQLLTVREMLCFLLYHNAHHLRRIAERAVTPAIASRGA